MRVLLQHRLVWPLSVLLMLSLVACSSLNSPIQTTAISQSLTEVCKVWKIITYSAKSDSAETIEQVRQNNAARRAYCGGS